MAGNGQPRNQKNGVAMTSAAASLFVAFLCEECLCDFDLDLSDLEVVVDDLSLEDFLSDRERSERALLSREARLFRGEAGMSRSAESGSSLVTTRTLGLRGMENFGILCVIVGN